MSILGVIILIIEICAISGSVLMIAGLVVCLIQAGRTERIENNPKTKRGKRK